MSVRQANGTIVTRSTVMSSMTDITPTANKLYQYTGAKLFKAYTLPGRIAANFEKDRAVAFLPGATYTQDQIDAYFPAASITSITPNAGGVAGGTAVVIKGVGFSGASGVTFGGTAGTSFSVVDDQTINVTTPAKTAGAYTVQVTDDGATNPSVANGFTYS